MISPRRNRLLDLSPRDPPQDALIDGVEGIFVFQPKESLSQVIDHSLS
jgi:hypothetical protein